MDDILIQSKDPEYIQSTLNFFDHDARVWGLDMNVSETEVQAVGNSPQRDFVTTRHNFFATINLDTGRPRNFYKYLGVYLYTQDQSKQLASALRAEIRAYFANIDPLPLTLSEKVRLVNKQLHPMIAYRLLGHCLPVEYLNLLEKDVWRALQRSSITFKVCAMDRPHPRSQGGLEISSLPIIVHVRIVNSALRCLTRVAPLAVAGAVNASLFSHTSNPLQNMIIDSAHFLQLSYHSMGVWRHTPVQDLQVGETLKRATNRPGSPPLFRGQPISALSPPHNPTRHRRLTSDTFSAPLFLSPLTILILNPPPLSPLLPFMPAIMSLSPDSSSLEQSTSPSRSDVSNTTTSSQDASSDTRSRSPPLPAAPECRCHLNGRHPTAPP